MAKLKKGSRAASSRRRQLRETLWPDIDDNELWLRTQRVGFTTVPRVMAVVGRIMDQMSGKGFPVFGTYFALWCWVFDEAFVDIRQPRELAFDAGFSGPRAEATWRSRMRKLQELGFIQTKPGLAGEYQYVLILNPIKVVEKAYEARSKDAAYMTFRSRLIQIGADDLDPVDDEEEELL